MLDSSPEREREREFQSISTCFRNKLLSKKANDFLIARGKISRQKSRCSNETKKQS